MIEQPRISAFDLATASAVAYGCFGARPRWELWSLGAATRGASQGQRGLDLMRRLVKHFGEYQPQKVFIEMPLSPHILVKIGSTPETARFLPGVVFLTETVCASRGIECELVERQAVLKHFVGRSGFRGRKGEAKRACIARCWQLGWKVDSEDEADALALWDYATAYENPSGYLKQSAGRPMFQTT